MTSGIGRPKSDDTRRGEDGVLVGERILLDPLRVAHAEEMIIVLDDPVLHHFTGGQPPSLTDLRAQYSRQTVGRSPDGSQRWLNWIVRLRETGSAVGYVQATVAESAKQTHAELAWVIGTRYQGHGYAQEAVAMMIADLRARGTQVLLAHIHPDHHASIAVARHAGLVNSVITVDGEVRWEGRF